MSQGPVANTMLFHLITVTTIIATIVGLLTGIAFGKWVL